MSFSISASRQRPTRRQFTGALAALLACPGSAHAQTSRRSVSFGVFSLFEPQEITLEADSPLLLSVDDRRYLLSPDAGHACVRREDNCVEITFGAQTFAALHLRAMSPTGGPASFLLAVPPSRRHGSMRRAFHGTLEVHTVGESLQPMVSMDRETAVASIVDAESPRDATMAFLMAQAIASRSFLVAARTAHTGFDFCDTTHCQYLRGPVPAESPANIAAVRTSGLCLNFEGRPLAAMYSRSCSGRTNSLIELDLPIRDYPYYPAKCEFCLHHPETWERQLNQKDPPRGERERIAFDRIRGWSAIPSGSFTQAQGKLEGLGIGHGLGLCQRGAAAMAKDGARFAEILAHYYANTGIAQA
jgi:hypothetical protein